MTTTVVGVSITTNPESHNQTIIAVNEDGSVHGLEIKMYVGQWEQLPAVPGTPAAEQEEKEAAYQARRHRRMVRDQKAREQQT
jgi:lipocalin